MSEMDGVVFPVPTNASKGRISAFAEDLAHRLKFQPGDALEPIVTMLGGQIVHHNPAYHASDAPESIRVFSNQQFIIYISSATSLERDRFTVAHELGHFFLHYPMASRGRASTCMVATRWVDDKDPIQKRAEWEANWFAAAFLMPSQEFKSEFERSGYHILSVASRFRVSSAAAEVRAKNLGLLL